MARAKNEDEKLDDNTIAKVIAMLEPEEGKPITKKLACELLGIAYNTTRLTALIEKFKEKKERQARMRAEKRGKPVTLDELQFIITSYLLDSEPVSAIVESSHRSAAVVHKILEENAVPVRGTGYTYFKPEMVPEAAMRDHFEVGEIVYSMRYDSCARIEGVLKTDTGIAYRMWLLSDKWNQSCYQPAEELASLEHLRKLGIKV